MVLPDENIVAELAKIYRLPDNAFWRYEDSQIRVVYAVYYRTNNVSEGTGPSPVVYKPNGNETNNHRSSGAWGPKREHSPRYGLTF